MYLWDGALIVSIWGLSCDEVSHVGHCMDIFFQVSWVNTLSEIFSLGGKHIFFIRNYQSMFQSGYVSLLVLL